MKHTLVLTWLTAAASLHAQDPAALTASTLNAAGGSSAGGEVEIESALGGFGGLSSDAGTVTARAGFPGQIYDPVRVAVTPGTATLVENDLLTFTAEIICDDDTLLPESAVGWSVDSQYLNVTAAGEVTAGIFPESFISILTATSGGVTGTALLTVSDPDPDNYGDYAGDGLPDAWQLLYFGTGSPDAGPLADPDADGQNNRTEYFVGTDPQNAASFLALRFGPDPAPDTRDIVFSPFFQGRSYTLEWSAALTGPWTAIQGNPSPADAPGEGRFTDTDPAETRKFYRLRIPEL